jgi:hypothetical protein
MRHFLYSVKNAYILMGLSSTALKALEYVSYFNYLAQNYYRLFQLLNLKGSPV